MIRLCVLVLASVICVHAASNDPIKIGHYGSLTGKDAAFGHQRHGGGRGKRPSPLATLRGSGLQSARAPAESPQHVTQQDVTRQDHRSGGDHGVVQHCVHAGAVFAGGRREPPSGEREDRNERGKNPYGESQGASGAVSAAHGSANFFCGSGGCT